MSLSRSVFTGRPSPVTYRTFDYALRAQQLGARGLFELCGAHLPMAQALRDQRRLDGVHIVRLPRRAAVSAPHQRGIKASGHAVRITERPDPEDTP